MEHSKKVAIMQPYFFPYIGYFQLINAVDMFVFYDDVAFIKKGWINRNRILLNEKTCYFTIPCEKISQNKLINETRTKLNQKEEKKILNKVFFSYKKAPFFHPVFNIFESVIREHHELISSLSITSCLAVCRYLDIDTKLMLSSKEFPSHEFRKVDRLINITNQLNGNVYVNSAGGIDLYNKEYFSSQGIELLFLIPNEIRYRQWNDNGFIPWLSILDVLMFNEPDRVKEMLSEYKLV